MTPRGHVGSSPTPGATFFWLFVGDGCERLTTVPCSGPQQCPLRLPRFKVRIEWGVVDDGSDADSSGSGPECALWVQQDRVSKRDDEYAYVAGRPVHASAGADPSGVGFGGLGGVPLADAELGVRGSDGAVGVAEL